MCSVRLGTSTSPAIAARKWAHWARKEAEKELSRERPPEGETSWEIPLSSFQTCSGLIPAVPLEPRSPTPKRSPSPMCRQVRSEERRVGKGWSARKNEIECAKKTGDVCTQHLHD